MAFCVRGSSLITPLNEFVLTFLCQRTRFIEIFQFLQTDICELKKYSYHTPQFIAVLNLFQIKFLKVSTVSYIQIHSNSVFPVLLISLSMTLIFFLQRRKPLHVGCLFKKRVHIHSIFGRPLEKKFFTLIGRLVTHKYNT